MCNPVVGFETPGALAPPRPEDNVGVAGMGVVNTGMSIMGVGIDFQQVVKGLVLLAAIIFDVDNKNRA